MNSSTRHPRAGRHLAKRIVAGATLVSFIATPSYTMAALTEISNAPLASASTAQIPPNVMFVLDASGSMNSEHMPDNINGRYDNKRVGSMSHLCNTLYYNPSVTYPPAKKADGSSFANASFSSAENDPFSSDSPSGTTDLRSKFRPWGDWGETRGSYFQYTGADWNGLTATQRDTECRRDGGGGDGTGKNGWTTTNWKKVEVSAAEEQNFANWFSYYRTRLLLMKSAAGHAFNSLNDSFRVGFITICPQDNADCDSDTTNYTVSASKYLKIDNFTATHKQAWYNKFYAQRGSSYTPLRQALSRVGRHYGGKTDGINSGMPDDPIQYSCQQNFAILTTDGYWNYGYGRRIDGSTMDQQDGNFLVTPYPMLDGQMVTQTTVTTDEEYYHRWRDNCSGSTDGYTRRQRRTKTVITSVDPQGNSTSSTSYSPDSQGTQTSGCWPSGPTSWTTIGTPVVSTPVPGSLGGVANTLADVAAYYYNTDLRPAGAKNAKGDLVDTDNVPKSGDGIEDDKAKHQHMTTFTLGLGVSGTLNFQDDYKKGTGDFPALRDGTKVWPNPDPFNSSNDQNPSRIDDLWHAAVNGRGQAFSATDPVSLAVSLTTALTAIQAQLASAAAAATSSLEPTLTDRLVFTPTYTTAEWSGEVQAHEIDLASGAVQTDKIWSAQEKLDARVNAKCDTRKILLHRPGAANNLVDFTWNTDTCDTSGAPVGSPASALDATEQAFFGSTQVSTLTQWGLMTDGTAPTVNQKAAAAGANIVNFVRGQRGKEQFEPNDLDKLYRSRQHVLGDIVNSQPVYVRQPYFEYGDTGYSDFKTTYKDRTAMVYVAANDGMLHAFNGTSDKVAGGEESWAIIPREVLPRLHRLADTNWSKLHEYTVDGTPTVGDVYDPLAKEWRTIMVAPLNKGGRAYYAIDITDPDPTKVKMLWEFSNASDSDLGYSYGNPIISKLENGQWVVFVTSGLNNVSPGDGQGYLYVLDAMTGALIHKIGTKVGSTGTPSGLTKIRNWVGGNASVDNTTARVYGVDLQGNVWRFDVNNKLGNPSGPSAELLATVKDAYDIAQPITTRPELAEVGSPPTPFVYVATGRYLGASDVTDKQVQSIYAIRDPLTSTPVTNLRSELTKRTMTTDGTNRFTCTTAQKDDPTCDPNNSPKGWYVDLIDTGERVNVDMKLQLGTLVVASNVPGNTACEPGGYSYKNYFDYATGLSPAGQFQPVGARLSSALAVGINIIRLPDGRIVVIGMDSSGTPQTFEAPIKSGAPTGKRITWREIPQ
jgi:type IV pilus assembly protein PilY1